MQKLLIGSLVGGLIIFFWSFLSWTALGLHKSQTQYTENQGEIIEFLSGKLEEGSYFVPQAGPDATPEEYEEYALNMEGQPWALIHYKPSFSTNAGSNMFRGFMMAFLSVTWLCWLLMKIPGLDLKNTVLACLAVGMIGYMTGKYSEGIWFELHTLPDLIDVLVVWTLVGLWLGWWLNRGKDKAPEEVPA